MSADALPPHAAEARMAELKNCVLASKPFIDNRLERQIRKILDEKKKSATS